MEFNFFPEIYFYINGNDFSYLIFGPLIAGALYSGTRGILNMIKLDKQVKQIRKARRNLESNIE